MAWVNFSSKTLRLKLLYTGLSGSGHTAHLKSLAQNLNTSEKDTVHYGPSLGRDFTFLSLHGGDLLGFQVEMYIYAIETQVGKKIPTSLFAGLDGLVYVFDRNLRNLRQNIDGYTQTLAEIKKRHHSPVHVLHYSGAQSAQTAAINALEDTVNTDSVPSVWGATDDFKTVQKTLHKTVTTAMQHANVAYQNRLDRIDKL